MKRSALCYRVQHLAGRDEPLARLLDKLPPAVEVITDDDAPTRGLNPFRNYLRCLGAPPEGVTHLCVLQDDVILCSDFDKKLREAIKERPDDLISLFVGNLGGRTRKSFYEAMKRNERWAPIYFREVHHVVGLVWPIPLAAEFLDFVASNRIPGARPTKSDDAAVGYWARKTKHQVWATVPCLVEHPDDVPSTVHPPSRQGDKGRRAIHFVA